jgi:hypothetical protein
MAVATAPAIYVNILTCFGSGAAAKVRCRTCYSDHDYRNEQAPPTKKELAKQKELYNAVLAGVIPGGIPDVVAVPDVVDSAVPVPEVAAEVPAAALDKKKKK